MNRLHVRFEQTTQKCIAALAEGSNETMSAVAREAMDIGIGIIQTRLDADGNLTLKQIGRDQFLINSKA